MVKGVPLPIIWDRHAKNQLKKAYYKILEDSYQGAVTVRDGILNAIDEIPSQPYKYPVDRFKKNNNGKYRAFELYSYRIVYKITNDNIQILRIRHAKREPLKY